MGISAIYEYAAIAIAGSNSGANLLAKKIAVGPSAPPMIAIAAASRASNPRKIAIIKAT